jgi:hypothetical protein
MMIHHMGYTLRAQIHRFSGKLCNGMGKVTQRCVEEMLYGIQATKDVKLSNIRRSLHEHQALIKTGDRLSRN